MFSFHSHRFEIEIRFFCSIKNQVIFSFLRLRKSRFQLHNFDSNVMYINDSFSYYSLHVRNSYPRVPIICQQTDPALSVTCQSDHRAHHRQFRHLGVSPEVLKIASSAPFEFATGNSHYAKRACLLSRLSSVAKPRFDNGRVDHLQNTPIFQSLWNLPIPT